uniref:VWFA domain-containing protein n=1 Tax=Triticum urartu TaxID=4572 RepID=A0A8R7QN14_TRIUA
MGSINKSIISFTDKICQSIVFLTDAGTLQRDTAQNVWLVPHTATNRAPLQEHKQQVLLELIGASSTSERSGLDLVAVLDISYSMTGANRLGRMKTAMQFVIRKLSPNDRLSIVTFSDDAQRLCHLRSMTQASKAHLEDLVDGLGVINMTNMEAGLKTGHQILDGRRIARGRVASIFVLSDGDQNKGDARTVDVSDVAVYTFGFGADSNHKVLGEIAMKSKGGTFNFVEDGESMSEPFSQILGGLLSIVVQDLKLTVSPKPGDSTIEKVNAGLYQQTKDTNTGSVTVSFGDLFAAELRNIMIDVLLPTVHRSKNVTVIIASCTYSINGKPFVSHEFRVTIRRTGSADPSSPISEAVLTEQVRQIYIEDLRQAITLADSVGLQGANTKLVEARNNLQLEQSNSMIDILRAQLDKLIELISSGMGLKALRACLLSMMMLHGRQRVTETGPVMGHKLYVTQFTDMSRKQAGDHEKDPAKVPPPASQDVEQAKVVRDQQGIKRPPAVVEAATCSWRTWWRDRKSHHESSRWAMVILCTVLAVAMIVIGVTLLAVYLLNMPKMPYLVVSDAQLGALRYAQQDGTIQYLQLPITILAENNNSKADATFSHVDLALQFHGVDVALLRTPAPFVVAAESSLALQYNVVSTGRRLDPAGMRSMDESLNAGMVPFDLRGKARARWKVGIFLKAHFWTRISCRLHFFFPGNSTVKPTDLRRCRSR